VPICSLAQKQLLCSVLFTVQQDSDCLFSDWTASAVADEDLHMQQGQTVADYAMTMECKHWRGKYQGT